MLPLYNLTSSGSKGLTQKKDGKPTIRCSCQNRVEILHSVLVNCYWFGHAMVCSLVIGQAWMGTGRGGWQGLEVCASCLRPSTSTSTEAGALWAAATCLTLTAGSSLPSTWGWPVQAPGTFAREWVSSGSDLELFLLLQVPLFFFFVFLRREMINLHDEREK